MENIELAEAILKYVQEKKLVDSFGFGNEFAIKRGFKSSDVKIIVAELAAEGFIAPMANKTGWFILTEKGREAARVGLKNFNHQEKQRNSEAEKITRRTYIGTIITVIFTVLGVLLTIISIVLQYFGLM